MIYHMQCILRIMQKFPSVDVLVCRRFGLSTFRFVDVSVCRRFGLSTFWSVDVLVCRRFGLSTFWFVDVSVCRRFGLSTFRFVDVSVCRRFGLSTFWLSTFRFVDVLTSNPSRHRTITRHSVNTSAIRHHQNNHGRFAHVSNVSFKEVYCIKSRGNRLSQNRGLCGR